MKVTLNGRKRFCNNTTLIKEYVADIDRYGNVIFDYLAYKEDGLIKIFSITDHINLNGRFEFHQEFKISDLERLIAQV